MSSSPCMPADSDDKKKTGFDKYELEEACRTLERAAEIREDKKLMKALQPYLEKKIAAIRSLDDLRAAGARKGEKERAAAKT